MQKLLSPYGTCDLAVDGEEALEAFTLAFKEKTPYDLICLDIMLPKMDGQTVLKRIRLLEREHDLVGVKGVKVIMTTALSDPKNIMEAFSSHCEAYLSKPIFRQKLMDEMKTLGLI